MDEVTIFIICAELLYCMWIGGLYEHDHMCDYRNLLHHIH